MEHQLHFKIVFSMSKDPDSNPVYFKMDGQRFRNARTIKLHSGVTYKLDFTFRPAQILESLNVHGMYLPLEERNDSDESSSASVCYSTHWTTDGLPLTKKGEREHIPLVLKIKDKGTLRTSLQAKFYRTKDRQHCEWGSHFSSIEYECNANEHRNHVDAAKETFR